MADVVSAEVRSRMMSGIRSENTKPEMVLRKALHALGFRYRLHHRLLPGRPDIALPRYRAALFVHGCFWHGHECHFFKWPKTREQFWRDKIEANRIRDGRARTQLIAIGYRVRIVWECELRETRSNIEPVFKEIEMWLRTN